MINQRFKEIVVKATKAVHLFNYCELCEQAIPLTLGQTINQTVSQQTGLCDQCAALIPHFQLAELNGDLLNRPEIHTLYNKCHFDRLIAISPYQFPISDWLKQYKYFGKWQYQRLCARLLQYHLGELIKMSDFCRPDVVLPVPIHIKRWQQRGFNQTLPLASVIANIFNIECDADCLSRQAQTGTQAQASGSVRRKQLKGNFSLICDPNLLAGKHIALVDDVVTTGATVSEISRLLKAAKVSSVSVYCLALSL